MTIDHLAKFRFDAVVMVRTFKVHSPNNVQVYNVVFLTSHHATREIPRMYSPYAWKFALFDQQLHISSTAPRETSLSSLFLLSLAFLDSTK